MDDELAELYRSVLREVAVINARQAAIHDRLGVCESKLVLLEGQVLKDKTEKENEK